MAGFVYLKFGTRFLHIKRVYYFREAPPPRPVGTPDHCHDVNLTPLEILGHVVNLIPPETLGSIFS